jgi:ABC-type nitrate/sulfonate/bicarbonate transport system substrate-binding protein
MTEFTLKLARFSSRHLIYLPLDLAEHQGYLAEQNIQLDTYAAGNDDQIFEEIASNRADIGVGDPTFIATQKAPSEASPKIIASLVSSIGDWGYTAHPEIGVIKEAADLVTLRLGTFACPSTMYALLRSLQLRHPRILKSMQIIETDLGYQAELLAHDKADIVCDIEPMISYAESQGYRVILSQQTFFPRMLFSGITASGNALKTKEEALMRFTYALQKGLSLVRSDSEKAIKTAHHLFPALSSSVIESAVRRLLRAEAWPEQAIINYEEWRAALQLREQANLLAPQSRPERFIDNRFAMRAVSGIR